jgi:4-hydroxy-tetrahydrodipicolinate synthase
MQQWQGSWVALVTPMLDSGEIDYVALAALVDWHLDNNTAGIVVLGTTGEAATITATERTAIVTHVVRQVAGKVPVMVGTGTNATVSTIELTEQAKQLGADAALVVTPYYNKPTQVGLQAHFTAVADAVQLPLMLYNVPGRTACDLQLEALSHLAAHPNIVALKDATGDLSRLPGLSGLGLRLFSGDDATAVEFIRAGGHGVVSVVANLMPRQFAALCQAAIAGDSLTAERINGGLAPLYKALFIESNPIPIKWALAQQGVIRDQLRLPLLPLSEKCQGALEDALQRTGALKIALS